MPYIPYLNDGSNEDFYPEVGIKYWVIVRRENFEEAFEAVLNLIVERDHLNEAEDRSPSYRFDNGVAVHGEGISFYKEAPAGARDLCALYQKQETPMVYAAPAPESSPLSMAMEEKKSS